MKNHVFYLAGFIAGAAAIGCGCMSTPVASNDVRRTYASADENKARLSRDQRIFEREEMHGGTFTPGWNIPFGGGTLVAGKNYFYAISSGGLTQSPLEGPQIETAVTTSLDPALAVPLTIASNRIIKAGQVWLDPAAVKHRITYSGDDVIADSLGKDGKTVLTTVRYKDFSLVPLTGFMRNSPEELVADLPIRKWIGFHNFGSAAKWKNGSAYVKKYPTRDVETYFANDCTNSVIVTAPQNATPNPCLTNAKLEKLFPISLGLPLGNHHPEETYDMTDGKIVNVEGVRMWIAKATIPLERQVNQGYRTFYELNGNVYMGLLEHKGIPLINVQDDGSSETYSIVLNQAAMKSVQDGLITGAVQPGTQAGTAAEVRSFDMFRIGGHGVNGSLTPADLKQHYNIPRGLTGAGQTIAIVDGPGTGNAADDLNTFSRFYHLPDCTDKHDCFDQYDLTHAAPLAANAADWGGEIALDTQMVHGIAPGAHIIQVTAASGSPGDLAQAVNYAAGLPGVSIITLSFGDDLSAANQALEDKIFQGLQENSGMVIFASSGDQGHTTVQSYPAASPYVTGVGGTTIHSVAWKSPSKSETAWQNSGGGASQTAPMPQWQLNLLGPNAGADSNMRAVPDVAGVADWQRSAFGVYFKDSWEMSGGTSASSPMWAGIAALLAEHMARKGKSLQALIKATPGGFNGLIYQLKLMHGRHKGFHDITRGDNNLQDNQCALCAAEAGYDNVTGLGVPDVAELFSNF
jgi:hypothetical protein